MKKDYGITYWITGLSGAGKTTISSEFYKQLKQRKDAVVLLDGDQLREIMGTTAGYLPEER